MEKMHFSKVSASILTVTALLLGSSVIPSYAATPVSEKTADIQNTKPLASSAIESALEAHIKSLEDGSAEIGTVAQNNTGFPNIATPAWKLAGYEIDVTSVQNGTVMPTILASCGVGGKGGKCKLSRSVTTTASLSAGGGVDIKAFNANTSFTVQGSLTTDISSTSPKMNSRQMYVARPQGTFYIFKWRKYTAGIKTSSGSGTVFSPTGVQFRVVAS
jgi:hypothetical protein